MLVVPILPVISRTGCPNVSGVGVVCALSVGLIARRSTMTAAIAQGWLAPSTPAEIFHLVVIARVTRVPKWVSKTIFPRDQVTIKRDPSTTFWIEWSNETVLRIRLSLLCFLFYWRSPGLLERCDTESSTWGFNRSGTESKPWAPFFHDRYKHN